MADLKKNQERDILHFTLGRSGSAFISQILFHIFGENNVWAGHDNILVPLTDEQRLFITYRDFRDMAVSRWRTQRDIHGSKINSGLKMAEREVKHYFQHAKHSIQQLNAVYKECPAMLMKYEDFFPDKFDYIFSRIESHCGITIQDKDFIMDEYNFEKNKSRSDKVGTFKKVDKNWMHGNHVYKGEIGGWKKIVPSNLHDFVNSCLRVELEQWGYEV